MSNIKDKSLHKLGQDKMDWAFAHMPVLSSIYKRFEKEKPLAGLNVSLSIHLEAKTANLARTIRAGGATVYVTGSNPLSTKDDITAALVRDGFEVNAIYGADQKTYEEHLVETLKISPDIVVDDGGDLVSLLHTTLKHNAVNVMGGCEETTTGITRLKAMEKEGKLNFPMMAVNDAKLKYLFDNRYGTGQSVWDGIIRTTNLLAAGKNVVVAGYGWCGMGVAMRSKGLGANVIVCEVDPIKALEATAEGFQVMTMDEAAKIGDFFITVTGCRDVIRKKHFLSMKDGAVLCNAGHFDVEINIVELAEVATDVKEARVNITSYTMPSGNKVNLLAKGRLVNIAAADGHPIEIMDLSFAVQALSVEHIVKNQKNLENKVYDIPEEIDVFVASYSLQNMGCKIDTLTDEQVQYMDSWDES
ncbi:MAG: adenosylhomocysteinase [Clostridiales bacterium]|nr:adenosylhomocysteinase [Clostridiales bacterium]